MTCRATLEFDRVDWDQEAAFLCSRRKSDQDIIIFVPDFKVKAMKDVISCLYTGEVRVKYRTDLRNFKDLMDCLNVETVDISSLEIANRGQQSTTPTKRKLEDSNKTAAKKSRTSSKRRSENGHQHLPELDCEVCGCRMDLSGHKSEPGHKYLVHMLSHLKSSLFKEIPDLKTYFCPYKECNGTSFSSKLSFSLHISWVHKEIAPRIKRR